MYEVTYWGTSEFFPKNELKFTTRDAAVAYALTLRPYWAVYDPTGVEILTSSQA